MTNFEKTGIVKLYEVFDDSANSEKLREVYETSCMICCMKNISVNCDRCHVAATHDSLQKDLKLIKKMKEE